MIDFEVRRAGNKIALAFKPNSNEWCIHYLTNEDALKIAKELELEAMGPVIPDWNPDWPRENPAYLSGPAMVKPK